MDDFRQIIASQIAAGDTWLEEFKQPLAGRIRDDFAERLNLFTWEPKAEQPFLVETHSSDIGRYLDSVMALRSQYVGLEETAVRASLEYLLARKNNVVGRSLETNKWLAAREVQLASSAEAVEQLLADLPDPLAKAGAMYFRKTAEVKRQEALETEKTISLVAEKWDNIDLHLKDLASRHSIDGHAMNFSQRAGRLRRLITDDLFAAYLKAVSVAQGMTFIFGDDPAAVPPNFESDGFVDSFLLWHRAISRRLSVERGAEAEFTFTFGSSLPRRPLIPGDVASIDLPPILPDDFAAQLEAPSEIVVDPSPWLKNYNRLRVVGAALSFGTGDESLDSASERELQKVFARALLFAPIQKGSILKPPKFPSGDIVETAIRLPPAYFNRVRLESTIATPEFLQGAPMRNVDPRGAWTVKLSGWMFSDEGHSRPIHEVVADVRVHLRLRATFNRDAETPGYWAEPEGAW